MKTKFKRALTLVAVAVLATAAACKDTKKSEDVLAQDTSLTNDLAHANKDTSSQPQLTDVPVSPEPAPAESEPARAPVTRRPIVRTLPRPLARTPVKTTPAPQPTERVTASGNTERVTAPGSEKPLGVISSGSEIGLSSGQRICTNTNRVGDRFTAQIADPVMGANGSVIPVGASATVEILGHKTKSTVIGGAAGAAAGAVVASRNANYDGCVPAAVESRFV